MADLKFKEIELSDKTIFEQVLKQEQPEMSEYTFTNLFIWRRSRVIEFAEYKDGLIVKTLHDGKTGFYPPVGYDDLGEVYSVISDYAKKSNLPFVIERVPGYQVERLRQTGDDKNYLFTDDRDNYDYIYTSEKLAFLKGRKLDGKRGFVNNFRKKYQFNYLKYHSHMRERCLKMAGSWINRKGKLEAPQLIGLLNEFEALNQLLEHFDELDFIGGVLCVNGNPAAMTFGEPLNDDMFVVHFEKANTDYVGSYQMINQQFVQNEMVGKYAYVNREQDLGISGIRKAKKSYVPDRMLSKYSVTRN